MRYYAVVFGEFVDSPDYRIDGIFRDRKDAEERVDELHRKAEEETLYIVRDEMDADGWYTEDSDGNWMSIRIYEFETDLKGFYADLYVYWCDGVEVSLHIFATLDEEEQAWRNECLSAQEYGMQEDSYAHWSCEGGEDNPMSDLYLTSSYWWTND